MTEDIIRVGINGFGRIGRMVLRVTLNKPNIRVVAINDPFLAPDYMAYQLRYDSTQGKFPLPVTGYTEDEKDSFLEIENYGKIRVFQTKVPGEIEWDSCGVQYVIESTGIFLTFEKASAHLGGSVKQVLLSAPSKAESGDDAKPAPRMFVMGVNEETYDPNEPGAQIISNASCTTNCLAPIVKALDTGFGDDNGIDSGLMTTVHAVTATQKTVDAPSKKWRSGRGGFQNIIPASTGAAKAVGKVYPKLNGKLNGMAFRVPVPDGSVVDLTAVMKQPVTKEQLDAAMRGMSEGAMQGVLGYEDDQIVSSDIIGSPYSSIYDSGASMVQGNIVKVISWYDNEWGYSCRLVDLLQFVAGQPAPPPLQ